MRPFLFKAVSIFFLSTFFINANATTWGSVEVKCPLCNTVNTFQEVMSYGSYIYSWPSKYQLIYWPATDTRFLYSCKHCYYTAMMSDFDSVHADKKEALIKMLKDVKIDQKKNYYDIPMSERFVVAEKVYQIKEQSPHEWCFFYRVMGYHMMGENKPELAKDSRQKAIEFAKQVLADTSLENKKYYTLMLGCMSYFTGNNDSSKEKLNEALAITFVNKEWSKEDQHAQNEYYDQIAKDILDKIAKGEKEISIEQ
ncbi:DUF2225 domain-containing protein [Panacibacter ginsenosidivorans]|uniref:DUF2225 domain-containing protein n=1 Tax=Panacibacter ginsenosidivorans TaxID=1813871 RepID=A0A5B8VCX4_9BACT|nr:DUF2225 domain-containing protein [Panacibacter ginsenosidivorans]QEC68895.1 DUF2225 domain-containing protein [Panacibacter ginsenosidivorans]